MISFRSPIRTSGLLLVACALAATGCRTPAIHDQLPYVEQSALPRELEKMAYPLYRIEPPDILTIDAVHNIRPPSDNLRAGDQLLVRVANTIPADPQEDPILNEFKIINSIYQVQTDGTIDLGPEYGSVQVVDLTVNEAKNAIDKHLKQTVGLKTPQVAVSLADVSGKQPISGEHLVRMDGTVSLGVYGSVFVSGMTLDEAKAAIEAHLSKSIHRPEVNVDVLAYNSKSFYVVTDGGGYGEQVVKFPCTGNETVLDAISQIQGLSDISSKNVWIARPTPLSENGAQILAVDWRGIVEDGVASTNYQIFPGDRVYIKADCMIHFDQFVAKTTAPFERIFGFTLLGHGTVRALQFGHRGNSGFGGFGGLGGFNN